MLDPEHCDAIYTELRLFSVGSPMGVVEPQVQCTLK